jgi:hypothetical protein
VALDGTIETFNARNEVALYVEDVDSSNSRDASRHEMKKLRACHV